MRECTCVVAHAVAGAPRRPRRARLGGAVIVGLLAVVGVVIPSPVGGQDNTADSAVVRIVARELASGKVEFGLQQHQTDDSWTDPLLPRARRFPTNATVGRWLVSSPVNLSVNDVRIAARRLSDNRIEFGLQQLQTDDSWGDRVLPARRFFPTNVQVERWLRSSPVNVTAPRRAQPSTAKSPSLLINSPYYLYDVGIHKLKCGVGHGINVETIHGNGSKTAIVDDAVAYTISPRSISGVSASWIDVYTHGQRQRRFDFDFVGEQCPDDYRPIGPFTITASGPARTTPAELDLYILRVEPGMPQLRLPLASPANIYLTKDRLDIGVSYELNLNLSGGEDALFAGMFVGATEYEVTPSSLNGISASISHPEQCYVDGDGHQTCLSAKPRLILGPSGWPSTRGQLRSGTVGTFSVSATGTGDHDPALMELNVVVVDEDRYYTVDPTSRRVIWLERQRSEPLPWETQGVPIFGDLPSPCHTEPVEASQRACRPRAVGEPTPLGKGGWMNLKDSLPPELRVGSIVVNRGVVTGILDRGEIPGWGQWWWISFCNQDGRHRVWDDLPGREDRVIGPEEVFYDTRKDDDGAWLISLNPKADSVPC